jgi:dynein heavy chain
VWAVGGVLCEKDGVDFRREFSIWWKSEQKSSVKFPSKGTVFDYFVEINSDGQAKFSEWSAKIKQIEFDSNTMLMNQITVPTRETVSTSEFIKRYLYVQHPVLLIGNSGCGKTALALGVLREVVAASSMPNAVDQYNYQVINFNNYTDSQYLQNMLEQQLVKKAGKQYGPSGKVKLIYFIDDLNMPQDDGLGT